MAKIRLIDRLRAVFFIVAKGGYADMVAVYVALIIAGRRTFAQVPATLRDKVAQELAALDLDELAV